MPGIAIVGLNGSGKSTLNHLLCRELGWFEMDVEDYYFLQQRPARLRALDEPSPAQDTGDAYAYGRNQAQVEAALLRDMRAHGAFVLSCVKLGWSEDVRSCIDMVFWVRVPAEVRMERIRTREVKRFGDRALPGGDLYAQQERFRQMAAGRGEDLVEKTLEGLRCPVFQLDGALPPCENVRRMLTYLYPLRG